MPVCLPPKAEDKEEESDNDYEFIEDASFEEEDDYEEDEEEEEEENDTIDYDTEDALDEEDLEGQEAVIVGWGRSGDRTFSEVSITTNVTIESIESESCQSTLELIKMLAFPSLLSIIRLMFNSLF